MPRACSICVHPETAAITKALHSGGSIRDVASRFVVTPAAVGRHLRGCLRTTRRAEKPPDVGVPADRGTSARLDTANPSTLVAATARLVDEALDLLENAKRADDRRTALVALREARDGLALLMRAAGLLSGDAGSTTIVDQRRQSIAIMARFSEDELRALVAAGTRRESETMSSDGRDATKVQPTAFVVATVDQISPQNGAV
ncbi:MAG TPA: hypothetical protein VKR56_00265 [Candidatus Cybelea sp.]|nr:hypothetical protein [Candidatus Cybelea sp.]